MHNDVMVLTPYDVTPYDVIRMRGVTCPKIVCLVLFPQSFLLLISSMLLYCRLHNNT